MTADELPLMGPAWGLKNVWLAEGVPGGILWGGAIGYYLSERIVEGGNSLDTSDLGNPHEKFDLRPAIQPRLLPGLPAAARLQILCG